MFLGAAFRCRFQGVLMFHHLALCFSWLNNLNFKFACHPRIWKTVVLEGFLITIGVEHYTTTACMELEQWKYTRVQKQRDDWGGSDFGRVCPVKQFSFYNTIRFNFGRYRGEESTVAKCNMKKAMILAIKSESDSLPVIGATRTNSGKWEGRSPNRSQSESPYHHVLYFSEWTWLDFEFVVHSLSKPTRHQRFSSKRQENQDDKNQMYENLCRIF